MRFAPSAVLTLTLVAASCVSEPTGTPFVERSYTLQTEYTVGQGEPIFTARTGEYFEDSFFNGIIGGGFITDMWEEGVEDHKLIFNGVDRGRIDANYQFVSAPFLPVDIVSAKYAHSAGIRASRAMTPGASVFRDVHFEDFQTNGIRYIGVQIQVLEATPQRLRYRVTADTFGDAPTRAQVQAATAKPAAEADND